MNFPIFKTKIENSPRFDLSDPAERRKYFDFKSGAEIKFLREYLAQGKTFVGYLLGKKNSGKGTYSKLFVEAIESDRISHISIGDTVRDVHAGLSDFEKHKDLVEFLGKNYRGFHSIEEVLALIEGRNTSSLISSELIVALLKYEIRNHPGKALFIDGFPRGLDQINYAIFLRDLLGYREDPDFFVFINLPNSIIDERIKYRVICPMCKTPRSLKLLATKEAGYDAETKTFYLKCDTLECVGTRMVPKEGDELGIGPIQTRLETDEQIMRKLLGLKGVPQVKLRNSVPVDKASEYVNNYELTPEYFYELAGDGKVLIKEKPWIVNDDEGVPSYSLLPPAIVVSMIKQMAGILNRQWLI